MISTSDTIVSTMRLRWKRQWWRSSLTRSILVPCLTYHPKTILASQLDPSILVKYVCLQLSSIYIYMLFVCAFVDGHKIFIYIVANEKKMEKQILWHTYSICRRRYLQLFKKWTHRTICTHNICTQHFIHYLNKTHTINQSNNIARVGFRYRLDWLRRRSHLLLWS
jgi:hypothetical protein